MNSLFKLCGYGQRAVIALIIFSALGLVAAAQTVAPQSQGRHYGDPGFQGEPINLNVVNADIRDILNYITEQYGVNFVIDKSVKPSPITVNVSDVPWNVALDSILRSQELGVQVNGPILRVADSKALASEGEIIRAQLDNQLDGSPLYTEFIRLNYARAAGAIGRGSATSGTAASSSTSSGAGGASASAGGEGLLPIIKRRLSRRGSIEVDGRSNSLIITDVRQNIDAIKQLVAILDQPEPQVEIEARIVVASRNFSRDVGVQLSGMVFGPRGSGAQGGTLNGATTAQPFPPSLPTQGPDGSLLSKIPNTVIGLTTGIFGTAQISALISAGEKQGQAKVIATPRVTTLNNRKAKIESKTQVPVTTIQPSSGGTVPVATTTYIDVPLKLEITPQITDVGTVVLDVLAENASTPPITGGTAPTINSQLMETQVTVPDGGTTVVGGVLFDDERDSQDRTPGLSK
ncbi:MAG TPA: secretin N-terminal domain-containing protein, partial [Pyrinomonadaceae bacterium]|nr:secretin N-terminal domain-containing protein [Pyrinomonadaceae bacterium]